MKMSTKKGKAKPSDKALKAMQDWQGVTGFEFIHIEEVIEGKVSFTDAWTANVRWLEGMVADALHLKSAKDARMEEFDEEASRDE